MSSLSYVTTAGSRRKRKNAVDMSLYEITDNGPRGKGRPSKGGAALRAKRYYVKNHLMVLEKRKLKRYIVKVRKHIDENKYDSAAIMTKLKELCKNHIRRHFEGMKECQLLYFINLSREDQYLKFLNDEGQLLMDTFFEDLSDIPHPERLEKLQADIMKKHSMLLFQFCTLLSAYLLVHHIEDLVQNETFENDEQRLDKMKNDCLALYVVQYDHIIATYKDDEYQTNEENNNVHEEETYEGEFKEGEVVEEIEKEEKCYDKQERPDCSLGEEDSSKSDEPAAKKIKNI